MIAGMISGYLDYVLPVKAVGNVDEKDFKKNNVIIVGKVKNNRFLEYCQKEGLLSVPEKAEGYSIYVGGSPWCQENQIIAIAGYFGGAKAASHHHGCGPNFADLGRICRGESAGNPHHAQYAHHCG